VAVFQSAACSKTVTLASELAIILGVFALAFVVRLLVADPTDVSYRWSSSSPVSACPRSAVVVRAVTVHGVAGPSNAATDEGVPRSYQHGIVRGNCTPWFQSRSC
jgi:hypothetical protein